MGITILEDCKVSLNGYDEPRVFVRGDEHELTQEHEKLLIGFGFARAGSRDDGDEFEDLTPRTLAEGEMLEDAASDEKQAEIQAKLDELSEEDKAKLAAGLADANEKAANPVKENKMVEPASENKSASPVKNTKKAGK